MPSRRLSSILRHRWAPDAAILAVAFVATLVAEWRTIVDPAVYPVDATIHTYWMARFDDPALFAG
ncbi:MAG TPA: hypothetical protein VM638_03455, partial [Actinomycetota bacterium]|nr:hypothetical protein [Actinomycetota bacterium]